MATAPHLGGVSEWRLYQPILAYWAEAGFRTASQVTDPRGTRWEVDVVAFTPSLDDVRVTEVKTAASRALVEQGVDRLRLASRVYVAVPAEEAQALVELAEEGAARTLGVLGVYGDSVDLIREPTPTHAHRQEGQAQVLERALAASLAEDP